MPGFDNNTMYADNVDFRGVQPVVPQMVSDGQLLIGATASPHIRAATLTPGPNVTVTNGPGSITIGLTGVSTTDLHTARFIVGSLANGANYATIASAIAAASSGDTIFIQTGTYTENLTLKAGVNLAACGSDGLTTNFNVTNHANVIILGTVTASYAGSVSLFGIQFQPNGAAALATSGASNSELMISNCSFYVNGATTITFANANCIITFYTCYFINNTTDKLFDSTGGSIDFEYCVFLLTKAISAASTISAGRAVFNACEMQGVAISATSTGGIFCIASEWGFGNTTLLTTAGTGISEIYNSDLISGTASAISIGSGTTVTVDHCTVSSSNANAITGAGTLKSGIITFSGSSSAVDTTTQTAFPTKIGIEGTFTPTLIGGTVAGTTTYSSQNGYYTRIGNLVTVNAYVVITGATGTGNVTLGGLPFTIRNQTFGYVNGAIFWQGGASWTWPAGTTNITCLGNLNTTTALVWASGTATAGGFVQMANAALAVTYSLTYQI